MNLTATHIHYYIVCKRKLWLFANDIGCEHTSDLVYEGKLISETTYPQRSKKYTELELKAQYQHIILSAKIDFYDVKNKVVHEVKKSDKLEQAHIAQVQFYLYVLEQNGVEHPSGLLEYPRLRQTMKIPPLNEEERKEVEKWLSEIVQLRNSEKCPPRIYKKYCHTCSYFEFCYVE
ncbi:MAG: CRISPR-associated protein Cas4 [Cytophagales bacterium]|nr:CRISPR-associated protein Cas4 [Cytophagales bacterium]